MTIDYRVKGGIIFVFILSSIVFLLQIYLYGTKKIYKGTESKYSGILDNYEGVTNYILKIQLILQVIIFPITIFIGINMLINYSHRKTCYE